MIILLSCFILQSSLVYFDTTEASALSSTAQQGRRLWHRHNCQSCHQFYGFGGFIGPDLTNATQRLTPERIENLMTLGSAQMPAFKFNSEEIEAISMFLSAMNETGQGQARFDGVGPATRLVNAIEQQLSTAADQDVLLGYDVFTNSGCKGCHIEHHNVTFTIPDLIEVSNRLDPSEIMDVLENGRPPRMLAPQLTQSRREQTYAFLRWLGLHRRSLSAASTETTEDADIDWSKVPWWEF